ncbi:MAG: hypothetical protein NWE76_09885 [Candidatus Bathyarchaeota archaeon]|nr:hypothetical protein [Candidatus Bathyarchaeota archaeon]
MSSVGRNMRTSRIFSKDATISVIAMESPDIVKAMPRMMHQGESIGNALRIV